MKRFLDYDHGNRSYSLFDEMFDARLAAVQPAQISMFTVKNNIPENVMYYWPYDLDTGEESDIHRNMRLRYLPL